MGPEIFAFVLGLSLASDQVASQQRVAALIGRLGDGHFQVREEATANLRPYLRQAYPQLRKAARHPDLEVALRASRLLDDYYATLRPTSYPVVPWIDMLPPDYPRKTEIMAQYLAQTGRSQDPDYTSYRQATLLYIRDMMENHGWEPAQAVELLDAMAPIEQAWREAHHHPRLTASSP